MTRVLIVDDEMLARNALARLCRRLGLETAEAGDGLDALAALRRQGADIMLLDLMMPALGGLGVLEKLREEPVRPAPNILLVTGATDAHARIRGAELGALDFVEKPYRLEDLERRLRRTMAIVDLDRRLGDAEKALTSLRRTDATTGVGSFTHLHELLDAEFRAAELSGHPLACVLLCDEGYGPTLTRDGRDGGERRLVAMARSIEPEIRRTDFLFRVDAAEFVVLAPATDRETATALATRMGERALAVGVKKEELPIALASYPHPQINQAAALYRAANVALAKARSRPAHGLVVFDRF